MTSLDLTSGDLRLIEVKGLWAPTGEIVLTPNERRVAEDRRDCYWLYIVTNCGGEPEMREPIPDPARFPWQEVSKVEHYSLSVAALTGTPGKSSSLWPDEWKPEPLGPFNRVVGAIPYSVACRTQVRIAEAELVQTYT